MSFIDAAQRVAEPIVVELKLLLDDGKKMAIKCRPLVTIDYFSMPNNGFNGAIPILTGQKNADDMDPGERVKMYLWFREVVKNSVIAVRDLDDNGTVWRSIKMHDDTLEAPSIDADGRAQISMRILEMMNGGDITDIAAEIIKRTNQSRELEVAKRRSG